MWNRVAAARKPLARRDVSNKSPETHETHAMTSSLLQPSRTRRLADWFKSRSGDVGWAKRHWFLVSLTLVVVAGSVGANLWLYSCAFTGCPTGDELRAYRPAEGSRIVDRQGRLMGRLRSVNRVNVPLTRVPRHVQQAFVATEDRRFEEHDGIDWRGFGRALVRNVLSLGVREGFSTITMQAARNAFLDDREALRRSVGRKLIELRLARLMERHLTKSEILELYLNEIPLGNGAFGVEAASRDLFGKGVRDISVAEGATLAALAKGPSWYTPKRHPDRALERRNLVLELMEREGFLTAAQRTRAASQRLSVARVDWRPPQPNESFALDAVRTTVDSVLQTLGHVAGEVVVVTTLDLTAQRAAERSVRQGAARIQRNASWEYGAEQADQLLQGAMVAIDPRNGAIRALVGGREYERTGFNRALAAHRQPGSAFKPFVYATALMSGYTPATIVDDEPITIDVGEEEWSPANYGDEYRGPVTMRQALAHSANAATVRISRSIGEQRIVDVAHRNGIASDLRVVPALALGAVEVTPIELVTAYAPFANGGSRVRAHIVERIETATGHPLWQSPSYLQRVMDPRDAFQVTSMLRSVIDEGTGRALRNMGITGPVAGKTGTTNSGTDVWFVGYTPDLIAGFWFGYDTPRPMGESANGGRYAAPAWADFYRDGWRERAPAWTPPNGLVQVTIDPETGKLADEWCPSRRREWFKAGTEPTAMCNRHQETDFLGDIIGELHGGDFRPLTRALQRLIDRR